MAVNGRPYMWPIAYRCGAENHATLTSGDALRFGADVYDICKKFQPGRAYSFSISSSHGFINMCWRWCRCIKSSASTNALHETFDQCFHFANENKSMEDILFRQYYYYGICIGIVSIRASSYRYRYRYHNHLLIKMLYYYYYIYFMLFYQNVLYSWPTIPWL